MRYKTCCFLLISRYFDYSVFRDIFIGIMFKDIFIGILFKWSVYALSCCFHLVTVFSQSSSGLCCHIRCTTDALWYC